MNKKVLWISLASVATLGVGGFFAWRYFKNKKDEETTPEQETKQVAGKPATPPPHIDINENVIYFSATWCPACKQNEPVAAKIFDQYKEKVDFIRVDANEERAKSYGYQLKQSQIPALLFVNDGEVLERLVGVRGEEEYHAAFQKYFPSLFEEKAEAKEEEPTSEVQPVVEAVEDVEVIEEVKEEPKSEEQGEGDA